MPKPLLILLAAIASLGQFANAVYLPSLPAIAADMQASPGLAHATLTAFLIGFVVAQLVFGPLSDQFGRRRILFWGQAIYVLASIYCVFAPTIEALIGARLAQGVGACAGLVIARAIARDRFSGTTLSVAMAVIATVVAIVPGFVPLLGGILQDHVGWHSTFAATALLGVLVTLAAWFWLPESAVSRRGQISFSRIRTEYGQVVMSATFRRNAVTAACGMAGWFAFNAASPALFIDRLGTSATEYGIYPMITVCGYFIGTTAAARLIRRVSEPALIVVGAAIMLVGALLMLAMPLTGTLSVAGMVGTMFVFVAGFGIVLPLTSAAALQDFPHCAGTASSMLGCVQMGGAAVGATAVGLLAMLQDAALAATMALFSVVAIGWYIKTLDRVRNRDTAGGTVRLP
jgi:DHA1 family bicyclomycin/chloramphenicol resistance-like MFS transporter